jgi:hypothetical protein
MNYLCGRQIVNESLLRIASAEPGHLLREFQKPVAGLISSTAIGQAQ